jgi:hypothetical protein
MMQLAVGLPVESQPEESVQLPAEMPLAGNTTAVNVTASQPNRTKSEKGDSSAVGLFAQLTAELFDLILPTVVRPANNTTEAKP